MTYTFSKKALQLLISKIKALVSSHTGDKSNPHGVTKSQVGLGNVANTDQSKAIKSITRSGTTFTATALDGTTSTFTQQDNNTTYGNMKGASSSAAGISGLVPAPAAGKQGQFLRGDGTWSNPANTTYSVATQSANGLLSAADKKALDREFFRMLPNGGTVISNGANLNSTAYLKVGNYYQSLNVNTSNMTNIPIKEAFMMYVLSPLSATYDNESTSQWVCRLRIFVNYNNDGIYIQAVNSGSTAGTFTYGSWKKLAVSKSDVGLGNVANLDQSKAIKSITRSGTTFTATALDGTTTTFTQQDNNTTYSDATTSAHGLMTAADKAKLNGIATGANAVLKYETHTVSTSGWTAKTIDSVSYKAYAITLTNTFDPNSVTVSLTAASGKELPTDAEAQAYGTPICTLNGKTLYVCKTAAPSTAFTILVGGKTA